MTPAEELQNIDAQIDRLTREVERLLCERREIINRAKFNEINELRMYRNGLVHGTDFAIPVTAVRRVSDIYSALNDVHEAYKKFGFASAETNQAISTFYRL